MPELPVEKQETVKSAYSKSRALLIAAVALLASIVIVLVIVFVFKGRLPDVGEPREQDKVAEFISSLRSETASLTLGGGLFRRRFSENLDAAENDKDPKKRFEALSANFEILNSFYSTYHDPNVRVINEGLRDFLKANFYEQYSEEKFKVPCLDSLCADITFSPLEQEIADLAKEANFKDPEVGKMILLKLEEANLEPVQKEKFRAYSLAYQMVASEVRDQKNSDAKLGELAEKLKRIMKETDGFLYKLEEAAGNLTV